MNGLMKAATVFAAGAAAMYFLDPEAGRRRRALARDKGVSAANDLEQGARRVARRTSDRAHGAMAEVGSAMDDAPVSDEKLKARIRSELGHLVDRPGDISVEVNDGHVVLSGSASPDEVASVAREVAGINGVSDVENRMQ